MGSSILTTVLHVAILAVLPPFFLGVIARTKAFFAGRKGPPILQGYFDLIKLFRKGSVLSASSSIVFRLVPVFMLVAILGAGLLVPLFHSAPINFEGDVILFCYLLGLVRFLGVLSAMDVGSSFEGMGASREAAFGALAELALFMGFIVLVTMTHSLSLQNIFDWDGVRPLWDPALLLLFLAFFIILLTENSRMPIDDPATHLELTMIHEVMILDNGGPNWGLVLYGAWMKLFIFMALAVSILWPTASGGFLQGIMLLILKVTMMSIAIGIIEATRARLRMVKIPQLLIANFIMTMLSLLIVLVGRGR